MNVRLSAAQAGQSIYSGNPCKHGHGDKRYTSSGQCVKCCALSSAKRNDHIRNTLKANITR